jgi:acyl carrier protein
MDRDVIRTRIRDLLADIGGDDSLVLTETTKASDVPWWDSLAHLRLLVAIEEAFNIKFTISELTAAKNIGELVDQVAGKQ